MAHMNKAKKAKIAEELKKVVPAGWKYTLAVHNYSTIVMTISAAPVDLLSEAVATADSHGFVKSCAEFGYMDINPYNPSQYFTATLVTFQAIIKALNTDNFDDSDSMTDYFHVGHYVNVRIGRFDKPFIFIEEQKKAA